MNEVKIRNEIANLIKEGRLKAGLTQDDMADRLNIKQPTYAQYERATRVPGVIQFMDIFEAMGLDPGREMDKLVERVKE
jgi:transcriptional regulator with XRE-family HTH domain